MTGPTPGAGRRTTRACPTCTTRSATLVHALELQAPDGHPLSEGYDIVSCLRCGTGFADVVPAQEFYDAYYAQAAKYAHEASADQPAARTVVAQSEHTSERLDAIAARIAAALPDRSARILDIGCANGTLLAALRDLGYPNVLGLDPSPESQQIAGEVHGVRVEVGTLSSLPSGLGTFDAISLVGVLEHLWDVDASLTTMIELLEPDGVIYFSLPDASAYLDPYIAPFQDFGIEHVNHFSPASLRTLAARFGYEIDEVHRWHPDLVADQVCAAMDTVWRPVREHRPLPTDIDDEGLRDVLYLFADRSQRDFAALDRYLEDSLGDATEFAVWGAGEFTMKLLALPALRRRRLVRIVDGNGSRRSLRFNGLQVLAPGDLAGSSVPVVIGSLLSAEPIRRAAEQLGLTSVVSPAGYEASQPVASLLVAP